MSREHGGGGEAVNWITQWVIELRSCWTWKANCQCVWVDENHRSFVQLPPRVFRGWHRQHDDNQGKFLKLNLQFGLLWETAFQLFSLTALLMTHFYDWLDSLWPLFNLIFNGKVAWNFLQDVSFWVFGWTDLVSIFTENLPFSHSFPNRLSLICGCVAPGLMLIMMEKYGNCYFIWQLWLFLLIPSFILRFWVNISLNWKWYVWVQPWANHSKSRPTDTWFIIDLILNAEFRSHLGASGKQKYKIIISI